MLDDVTDPQRYARHSTYSDPGRHAALVAALPDDVDTLGAVSRNLVAHYRAQVPDLPAERRGEIDSRWVESILTVDQGRHPADLTADRPVAERVAGCCRDHSLLLTGFLRHHGRPARNVVGFAGYFAPPFHHDHVVIEHHDGRRWVRTDPELHDDWPLPFDRHDMPTGAGAPFQTAAEVWTQYRAGTLDPGQYGVAPDAPAELRGPGFVDWDAAESKLALLV